MSVSSNEKPQITVIVPVYNVEKYLAKCLESIINQTYKDLEIIVINDGSTDSSGRICDQYAKLDSRIRVIHQSNAGISEVRNRGIDATTSKYVTFVDSDDFLNLDAIEILYDFLVESDAQISIGHIQKIDPDGILLASQKPPLIDKLKIYDNYEAVRAMYDHQYADSLSFVVVTAKLYDFRLFDNLRFRVGKLYDDEFVNYKLLLKANKIVYSTQTVYIYLIRNDSITRSSYSLQKLSRLEALEERMEILAKYQMKDLVRKTTYIYFRELSNHLTKFSTFFPNEIEIYNSLVQKHKNSGWSLLKSTPITIKSYVYVLVHLFFCNLFKFTRK